MNHRTMKCVGKFLKKYQKDGMRILDVGSWKQRNQRCFKEIISEGYTGIDIRPGVNVDLIVLPYHYPFEDNTFDLVISAFMLEHSERFWDVFEEMVRVLKNGGKMCIVVPWTFHIHNHPVDCWRILPDGMAVLAKTYGVNLLKSYVKDRDCIGIFCKC